MARIPSPRLIVGSAWSFGRNRRLASDLEDLMVAHELEVVDLWSDPDLNRTEITTVGPNRNHIPALIDAADLVLPSIDLNRHTGNHSRLGALDHVRFEPHDPDSAEFGFGVTFAETFAEMKEIPVYYDGPEAEPGAESRILRLRQSGFGALGEFSLPAEFGPAEPHAVWGVTVVTVGPRQATAWVDLHDPTTSAAGELAVRLNYLRESGEELLLGVRSEGFALPTLDSSRLSLVFEMPEQSSFDEVIGVVGKEARLLGAAPGKAYARGAWLESEALRASRLVYGRKQVLEDVLDGL